MVLSDFIHALGCKKHCVALFIDLSKAFDTVDHALLLNTLNLIAPSNHADPWFKNYLEGGSQCVKRAGSSSFYLEVSKGVPQGLVLGPILFSVYINSLCVTMLNASYHLYEDDTVIYCCSNSYIQAFDYLQSAFNLFQCRLQI